MAVMTLALPGFSPLETTRRKIETCPPQQTDQVSQQTPITTFPTAQDFIERHGEGATIEMQNELQIISRFNQSRRPFPAWIIAPIKRCSPLGRHGETWMLLTIPPHSSETAYPDMGERCRIALDHSFEIDGERISPGFLDAERIDNPLDMAGVPAYAGYAAFQMNMPTFKSKDGSKVKLLDGLQVTDSLSLANLRSLRLSEATSIRVIFQVDSNLTTFNAEIGALHLLTDPKKSEERAVPEKNQHAFERLLDFAKEPKSSTNLFRELPHIEDPTTGEVPVLFSEMFKGLNPNHKAAYAALFDIPASLHMVSGCPGAGKTHWNLLMAGIATSKPYIIEDSSGSQRDVKILYLLDVNKPADDVADRMHRLYRDAGMTKNVIRMHGWPSEMKKSQRLNTEPASKDGVTPDFTRLFLSMAQVYGGQDASSYGSKRDTSRAPTLDQAAWTLFEQKKTGKYYALSRILSSLMEKGIQTRRDRLALRRLVYSLYGDALKDADFVATTPVSASGAFTKMFHPDLIFMDEAPHARELTSLIPIAYFSPMAWIFSGDFRQTRPFVAGANEVAMNQLGLVPNPYAQQLLVSTMERAEAVGAPTNNLLINHRGYGNLERLPSELFYDGRMVSGIPKEGRYPVTVRHLQNYLRDINCGRPCTEPRLLIHLDRASEAMQSNSFFNFEHEKWVMTRVKELLSDPDFRRVDRPDEPGRIMLIAPYTAAVSNYRDHVRRLPLIQRNRVDIRTIDTAQGHQSDIVFLDMVRTETPGFMDDAHRLCVAITRARQAEFILMHPRMKFRVAGGKLVTTKYLGRLWMDCYARGQLVRVC